MIVCSICKEMVVSSVEDVRLSETLNRVNAHYMSHSWLRRKWHNLMTLPRMWKLRKFQKETEALWRTQKK
jgi:hypothetical protein